VSSTAILQLGLGLTRNKASCEAAIFMCIFFYFTSKVIIYLFLIERVHIVRGCTRERQKDKVYIFNMFGLLPYCVIGLLAIIFRVDDLDESGKCLIGVERQTSILVIVYDLVINVYLTISFLLPILGLYSFRNDPDTRLRKVAQRTFVGTVLTLMSSVANITAIFVLEGLEPAFICLSCCTADVAFSATVLHWVTSVHMDDSPQFPVAAKVCAFHHRNSTICCMSPAAKPPKQGFFAMARELFGRMGRNYSQNVHSAHSMPQISRDMPDAVRRESKVGEGGREGITVTYDIWRTVEDTGRMGKGQGLPEGDREL